jgi:ubiquinone/menaquinone biosynthesis C-methylase UbiE
MKISRAVPVPDVEAMRRTSGNIQVSEFFIGGLTTFMQLDRIADHYFGRRVTEFQTMVDWGVGCARVLRHFIESAAPLHFPQSPQALIGFDIDPYNLNVCQQILPQLRFALLQPDGVLPLESHSVDLLYGISVMTHLSEHHQFMWLEEIKRVMRPGGAVILTIGAEAVYYRRYAAIRTAFVEKAGIAEMADPTLGGEFHTYRHTAHSRNYIRKEWGKYFEILDVIPAAMVNQDYVVLRAG